jgi:hypothetical protein
MSAACEASAPFAITHAATSDAKVAAAEFSEALNVGLVIFSASVPDYASPNTNSTSLPTWASPESLSSAAMFDLWPYGAAS